MNESVYKVVEIIGSSSESWEKAAANAVETAAKTLRDLRIAEVEQLDMHLEDGKVVAYRVKLKVSFKYESEEGERGIPGVRFFGRGWFVASHKPSSLDNFSIFPTNQRTSYLLVPLSISSSHCLS